VDELEGHKSDIEGKLVHDFPYVWILKETGLQIKRAYTKVNMRRGSGISVKVS
jgi:hypothetical protein